MGSYASSAVNDVEVMAAKHAARVYFIHLRNVKRTGEGTNCHFVESDHLDGEVDMYEVVRTFTREAARRRAAGAPDAACQMPFRPDHGHKMLDDLNEDKATNPGYTAIGRLRGLAEIRGLQVIPCDPFRFLLFPPIPSDPFRSLPIPSDALLIPSDTRPRRDPLQEAIVRAEAEKVALVSGPDADAKRPRRE